MIPRVCYVSDGARATAGRDLVEVLGAAVAGGLRMAVLRELEHSGAQWQSLVDALAPLRARGLRVLASRRLDVARALGLDGVHLAADAVGVSEARAFLGPAAWIGYSAHELEEARAVSVRGASYVTLSPIYPTDSKPGAAARGVEWLADCCAKLETPVLALGGVTAARCAELRRAGAWGVACAGAIGAARDPAAAVAELVAAWNSREEPDK